MKYLALDPGDTTGWALFVGPTGKSQDVGECKSDEEVYKLLDLMQPHVVICENYLLYNWKAKQQSWSPMNTVRLIGAIQYWCWKNGSDLILQGANKKPIAYRYAGMKPPKNHKDTHKTDAYVHGVYYLQTIGVRKPQQVDH